MIKSVIKISDDYDKKYVKVKFRSDDKLPLSKTIAIHNATIVARAVFHEYNKYLSERFLRWMLIWIIDNRKMSYYDRTDISEGTDFNKISKSKTNKTKINGCFFFDCRWWLIRKI